MRKSIENDFACVRAGLCWQCSLARPHFQWRPWLRKQILSTADQSELPSNRYVLLLGRQFESVAAQIDHARHHLNTFAPFSTSCAKPAPIDVAINGAAASRALVRASLGVARIASATRESPLILPWYKASHSSSFSLTLHTISSNFFHVTLLTVRWPDGRTQIYAGRPGPEAGVMLRDRRTVWRLMLNPKLSVGEADMDGGLVSLGGSIHDVLEVVLANLRTNRKGPFVAWLRRAAVRVWRPINQFNARARARRNVAHHYDLNGRLYSLFLDRDQQYSCAYFPKGTETLEEAQEAKKRHIATKHCLDRPGLSVLDIGCGWGGMALTLARDYGATVTRITLSTEQLAEAQARAEAEGLADRVSFRLLDYRAADRSFDRVVSVGMFEHVGVFHYRAFFDTVSRCLKPDGVALLIVECRSA